MKIKFFTLKKKMKRLKNPTRKARFLRIFDGFFTRLAADIYEI